MELKKIYEANRIVWNNKVESHLASEMYDMDAFRRGKNSLKHVEIEHLDHIEGKSILHLQCHFGQDSLSLQRMGARVTGVDISDKAIQKARELSTELGLETEFVLCNVLETDKHINKQFDMVFTSYGTVVWLADINKWANIVSKMLKPGGTFLMADFHPVMYMLDDDFDQLGYPYFTQDKPFHDNSTGTYADSEADVTGDQYFWNHPTSNVMSALLKEGLELEVFKEFPYSCYNCFPGMKKLDEDKYVFEKHQGRIPYMFLMKWKKKPQV
ncbi:MAG: class I SAM-dependent methyltransferase [Flavobacteriales bacterium]|nr:class I SAM-dependent methyltransferase [Flavobacteriales bacterium]